MFLYWNCYRRLVEFLIQIFLKSFRRVDVWQKSALKYLTAYNRDDLETLLYVKLNILKKYVLWCQTGQLFMNIRLLRN